MQPSRAQLTTLSDEIASATLVAANPRLAVVGIVLLDPNIEQSLPFDNFHRLVTLNGSDAQPTLA